tara:strand:- start:47 stop:199 length:153 start_codon:yes stop_codon:yes gene_type:complete
MEERGDLRGYGRGIYPIHPIIPTIPISDGLSHPSPLTVNVCDIRVSKCFR